MLIKSLALFLVQQLAWAQSKPYYGAELRTRETFRYGRFRSKIQASD